MQDSNPPTANEGVSSGEPLSEKVSPEVTDEVFEEAQPPSPEEPGSEESQQRSELEQAADRVLRLQAEMENLRNRTSREIAETQRYAALPLMRDLLPVVDNLARAMEAGESADSVESLLEGFRMVQQQLLGALAQHQCQAILAIGEPFDPNIHEAIQQQPSDTIPAQSVCLVTQEGYQLHDRVIRPSQVIVSTGPHKAGPTDS